SSPASSPRRPWSKRWNGSFATSATGPSSSTALPLSWRTTNGNQTLPRPQATTQSRAGKSLRSVDQTGANDPVVGRRRRPQAAGRRDRPARRRPLQGAVLGSQERSSQRERPLSRGRAQPQALLLVGVAEHAGA